MIVTVEIEQNSATVTVWRDARRSDKAKLAATTMVGGGGQWSGTEKAAKFERALKNNANDPESLGEVLSNLMSAATEVAEALGNEW